MHLSVRERLIVELVAQRGQLTTAELAAALYVTRAVARTELRELERAALIHAQRAARNSLSFTLTVAGTQAVAEGRRTGSDVPSSAC